MKLATVAVLLLFAATVFAQAPDTLWMRTFDSMLDNNLNVVRALPDGRLVSAGYCCFHRPVHYFEVSPLILQTDAAGNELWSHDVVGMPRAEVRDIRPIPGGGYIAAAGFGRFGAPLSQPSTLLRLDDQGQVLWSRLLDSLSWDFTTLTDALPVSAGGFLTNDFTRLIRTDDSGAVLWERHLSNVLLEAVLETPDGGFLAAGGDSSDFGYYNAYLAKLNAAGKTLWTRNYFSSMGSDVRVLLPTAEGQYFLAGGLAIPDGPPPFARLLVVDSAGSSVDDRTYENLWPVVSADRCADGGLILLCREADLPIAQLARLSAAGDLLWSGILPEGGDYASVAQTPDSGYVVAGQSGGNAVLIKYAAAPLPVGGLHPSLPSAFTLAAYPNPFNPTTTLSFSLPQTGAATLAVFDVTGREVWRQELGSLAVGAHTVRFDGQNLASGLYFARLEAGAARLTAKLLLVR